MSAHERQPDALTAEEEHASDQLSDELLQALEASTDDDASEAAEVGEPAAKRARAGGSEGADPGSSGGQELPEAPQGPLSALSEDLALQILACTSAADLTAVAQTSRFFRQVAADNELWRALFMARWGDKLEEGTRLPEASCWKGRYMDRDAQDVMGVRERVPLALQELYLQMLSAKRMQSARRGRAALPRSDVALRRRILRWRGARGLLGCPCPELGCKHEGCGARERYAKLGGGLFMCEACGWAHMCGADCPERLVDEPSEMLVCPVSGHCFERLLADWEEEGREAQQEQEVGNDFSMAGHWGRAYAAGYDCGSEEELRRRCGVAL